MITYKKSIENIETLIKKSEYRIKIFIEKYEYKNYINCFTMNIKKYFKVNDPRFLIHFFNVSYYTKEVNRQQNKIKEDKKIKNFKLFFNNSMMSRKRTINRKKDILKNTKNILKLYIIILNQHCQEKKGEFVDGEISIQTKLKIKKEQLFNTNFVLLEYTPITDLPLNLILFYL